VESKNIQQKIIIYWSASSLFFVCVLSRILELMSKVWPNEFTLKCKESADLYSFFL